MLKFVQNTGTTFENVIGGAGSEKLSGGAHRNAPPVMIGGAR